VWGTSAARATPDFLLLTHHVFDGLTAPSVLHLSCSLMLTALLQVEGFESAD
jgi:hypothetical protein